MFIVINYSLSLFSRHQGGGISGERAPSSGSTSLKYSQSLKDPTKDPKVSCILYHSFLCIDHCAGSVQFENLLLLPHSPKIRISEPLTATIASRRKIGDQMEKRPPFFAIEEKVH